MADLGAHLSQRGTLVDTNNDGIVDGFAHTVKNTGNFTTFSLTNGVLSLQPAAGGSSIGGADTQVQFNDGGSLNGESTFVYNKTTNTLSVSNLTVSDTLTVTTTTTLNSNTVTIGDAIIVLNSDATGSASANAGIEIERGDDTNVQLLWDETNDQWDFDGFALGAVGKVYGSGSGAHIPEGHRYGCRAYRYRPTWVACWEHSCAHGECKRCQHCSGRSEWSR